MEKTTVYFFADSFAPLFSGTGYEWTYGGAEMQMYYLAKGFAKQENFKVVLFVRQKHKPSKIPNIEIVHFGLPINRGVPYIGRYVNKKHIERTFKESAGKRILFLGGAEQWEFISVAKRNKIPIIYRINGDSLVDGSGIASECWIDLIMQRVRAADAVVTQSAHQKHELKKNYGFDSTVIPSCYEQSQGVKILNSYQKDDFILWVGRSVWVKDPLAFLNLAKVLPVKKFVLVSPPEEPDCDEAIRKAAESLDNVDFFAGMPHKELMELYRRATAVVSTSETEGLPNTLIEACFSYTPYISYRLSFQGVVGSEGIGICSEGSFEKLKSDVLSIFDDKFAESVAEKQLNYAKNTWNVDTSISKYIELIKDISISKGGG